MSKTEKCPPVSLHYENGDVDYVVPSRGGYEVTRVHADESVGPTRKVTEEQRSWIVGVALKSAGYHQLQKTKRGATWSSYPLKGYYKAGERTWVLPGYVLVPCDGEAHSPEVGGMIDHCGLCAPRWGTRVRKLTDADRVLGDAVMGRERAWTPELEAKVAAAATREDEYGRQSYRFADGTELAVFGGRFQVYPR